MFVEVEPDAGREVDVVELVESVGPVDSGTVVVWVVVLVGAVDRDDVTVAGVVEEVGAVPVLVVFVQPPGQLVIVVVDVVVNVVTIILFPEVMVSVTGQVVTDSMITVVWVDTGPTTGVVVFPNVRRCITLAATELAKARIASEVRTIFAKLWHLTCRESFYKRFGL